MRADRDRRGCRRRGRKKKKIKISTFLRLREPEPQTSPGREAIPGRKEVLHLRTYNPNAVSTKTDLVPSHEVHNGLERLTRISRVERSLVDIISRHLAGKRLRYFSRRIGGLGRRKWGNCVGEVVCRRGIFSFFPFLFLDHPAKSGAAYQSRYQAGRADRSADPSVLACDIGVHTVENG